MIKIGILQYGAGNVGSLLHSFSAAGFPAFVVNSSSEICTVDLLVFPGVGNALAAQSHLVAHNLLPHLHKRHAYALPTVGICLGAQLFHSYLEESNLPGLSWLEGSVNRLPSDFPFNNGWSCIDHAGLKKHKLGRSLTKKSSFYFNHGYFLNPGHKGLILSVSSLLQVPAIICHDHITAIQFHPEKSQRNGLLFLRNLIVDYYGF